MRDLKPVELPKESFEELQKKASAYCGFDLSKPADLSELHVDRISHETIQAYNGYSFTLTTRLIGWLENEHNTEDLIITIERKNVMRLPKVEQKQ